MPVKYKVLIIVGARPQIMKAAALANAIKDFPQLDFEIVHSGQHYDRELSDQFFEEFTLKSPKYNFQIGSESHNIFIAKFLLQFDPVLRAEKPDMVVVVGDTNTTAAAAIATAKLNIPLAHVEAGLREWDKSVPEEINKIITDSLSDLYFSPTNTGVENLVRIGVSKHVYMTGDITLDLLADDQYVMSWEETKEHFALVDKYVFMTCHRAVNTDNTDRLQEIVHAVNAIDFPIIWTLHPRTKLALDKSGLMTLLGQHIRLVEPLSYKESQSLIRYAHKVITDSGGVIKEAYFHKTMGIIIDDQTEWVETVNEGWNIVAGADKDNILRAFAQKEAPLKHGQLLGDGSAGYRIWREINKYLQSHS